MKSRWVLVAIAATIAGGPAQAESVRDWFVTLKRTAKEMRIAAQMGRQDALNGLQSTAYDHAVRAGSWRLAEVPAPVATTCGSAANALLAASKAAAAGDAPSYQKSMDRYRTWEDHCFRDFTAAERRGDLAAR